MVHRTAVGVALVCLSASGCSNGGAGETGLTPVKLEASVPEPPFLDSLEVPAQGVVVVGAASRVVEADETFVVVENFPPEEPDDEGLPSAGDVRDFRQALLDRGFAESDVVLTDYKPESDNGDGVVRLHVAVPSGEGRAARAREVVEAADDELGGLALPRVSGRVRDCTGLAEELRSEALENAQALAGELAAAAGVTLGAVGEVIDVSVPGLGPPAGDPCSVQGAELWAGPGLDADGGRELVVTRAVRATLALDAPGGETREATGTGTSRLAPAKAAIIFLDQDIDFPTSILTAQRRQDVIEIAMDRGFNESAVEFITIGSSFAIRIAGTVEQVRAEGPGLTESLERLFSEGDLSYPVLVVYPHVGAQYLASGCDEARAEARRLAVDAANKELGVGGPVTRITTAHIAGVAPDPCDPSPENLFRVRLFEDEAGYPKSEYLLVPFDREPGAEITETVSLTRAVG